MHRLLVITVRLLLSLIEPVNERLGSLSHLLGGLLVDVSLGHLGSPLLGHLLGHEIELVELEKDLGHCGDEIGVGKANETLNTTKQGLFVLVGSHNLGQQTFVLINLLDNVLVENDLGQNLDGLGIVRNTQLNGLLVDLHVAGFTLGTPLSKDGVGIVLLQGDAGNTLLDLSLSGSNGLGRSVDSPGIVVGSGSGGGKLGCLGVDSLGQLVVRGFAVLVVVHIRGLSRGVGGSSSSTLLTLGLRGRVLDDEGGEFVSDVHGSSLTTGLTVSGNVSVLGDDELSLGVLAGLTEHEPVDETVQSVLQRGSVVLTIDQVSVLVLGDLGLGSKLDTKVLNDVRRRSIKSSGNVRTVDHGSLDTVTSTLDLGGDGRHLVPVEGVGVISSDVDHGHGEVGGEVVVFVSGFLSNVHSRTPAGLFLGNRGFASCWHGRIMHKQKVELLCATCDVGRKFLFCICILK
jgi:hypothetical protein